MSHQNIDQTERPPHLLAEVRIPRGRAFTHGQCFRVVHALPPLGIEFHARQMILDDVPCVAFDIIMGRDAHDVIRADEEGHIQPVQALLHMPVKSIGLFRGSPGDPGIVFVAIDLRRPHEGDVGIGKIAERLGEKLLARNEVNIMLGDDVVLVGVFQEPCIVIPRLRLFFEFAVVHIVVGLPFA